MTMQSSGCSYPTGQSPYPGECAPLHPLVFVPRPNMVAVPTDVEFRITFDDYPDPDTVRSDSLLLTTGYFWVPGNYGVDLIGKAAVMRPIRGLSGQIGYGLHLRPALGSLAGCPGTSQDLQFMTGSGPAGGAPPAPTPSFATDVQPILDSRCAGGGCHLAVDDAGTTACSDAPAAQLSLCAADAWDALVGKPALQSDKLRRVQAGDSARSYLLRKLLPAKDTGGPIAGVYGQREPPGEPLPEDQLRLIAAWIDGGALR
ncbi:MAG TPA: hypothetical protein VIF57_24795 [Polyangia bacterium]|jgi:hypothetical protein